MNRNNLSKTFESTKAHINKAIYSYLFALIKYIFIGKKGLTPEISNDFIVKLKKFTKHINEKIIKEQNKKIEIENDNEIYTVHNFENIINFATKQNLMFVGDILEGILIKIFSYTIEVSTSNDFGKYVYGNFIRLREPTNINELSSWFEKANNIFKYDEIKDIKKLLQNDYSVNDRMDVILNMPIFHTVLTKIMKLKYNFLFYSSDKSISMQYTNLTLHQTKMQALKLYEDLKKYEGDNSSSTMNMRDFIFNSIIFFYYCFLNQPKPPINLIRSFLISVYIYNQNENSNLMKYSEAEETEKLVKVPFNYSLRGAFIEGRHANIIFSPIKIEPGIINMNFGQNNIREPGLFELGKILSFNKSIKSITLLISLIKAYYLEYLNAGFGIFDNHVVEELNMPSNYCKEEVNYFLGKLISHLKGLKTLNLSGNEIKGGLRNVFVLLKDMYRHKKTKLESLYLNNCFLDDSSIYELGEMLKSKYCRLKKLSLSMNPKIKIINFFKKIKSNKSLLELNISNSSLDNNIIDDLCRIISNTNIKSLILFKNDFNNFKKILRIPFRTKIVKKKNEITETSRINYRTSMMNLDLSSNSFFSINKHYINLINNLINDNSTLDCLDLSHVLYGLNPQKSSSSRRSPEYLNSVNEELLKTLIQRKEKFKNLTQDRIKKELNIQRYEKKNDENKLNINELDEDLSNDIDKIIKDEKSKYSGFLRKSCFDIINKINQNKEIYKDLITKEEIVDSGTDITSDKNENFFNKLFDYMVYKKSKEEFDNINLQLNRKNLVLI